MEDPDFQPLLKLGSTLVCGSDGRAWGQKTHTQSEVWSHQLLHHMIPTRACKSLPVVCSEFRFTGKGVQTSTGLGKFHLTLNCISLRWSKSGELLEHALADCTPPPPHELYSHSGLDDVQVKPETPPGHSARRFGVANTSRWLCLSLDMQKVWVAQGKPDYSIHQFDPAFKRMLLLFGRHLRNEFIPLSYLHT